MAGIVFLLVGGGIFARNREDPAPTVGQRGGCDDWHCDERARLLAICREGGTFAGQWGAMGMDGLAGIVFGVVGGGIFARDREDSPAHILVKPPNGNVPNRTATNAPVNRNARRAVSSR